MTFVSMVEAAAEGDHFATLGLDPSDVTLSRVAARASHLVTRFPEATAMILSAKRAISKDLTDARKSALESRGVSREMVDFVLRPDYEVVYRVNRARNTQRQASVPIFVKQAPTFAPPKVRINPHAEDDESGDEAIAAGGCLDELLKLISGNPPSK